MADSYQRMQKINFTLSTKERRRERGCFVQSYKVVQHVNLNTFSFSPQRCSENTVKRKDSLWGKILAVYRKLHLYNRHWFKHLYIWCHCFCFYPTLNVEWSDEEEPYTSALIKYDNDVLNPTLYSHNSWHYTTSQQVLFATVHWAAKASYHKATPELFLKKKIHKNL